MLGALVRAKECRLAICRDSRRRRHQTRDEVVHSAPTAAASRRVQLSDVPTSKVACSCQALFPVEPPRTRGLQKACPPDRFGPSILSARELRRSLRFPWLHFLNTAAGSLRRNSSHRGAPAFAFGKIWRKEYPRDHRSEEDKVRNHRTLGLPRWKQARESALQRVSFATCSS
jgi:hypothetical protein